MDANSDTELDGAKLAILSNRLHFRALPVLFGKKLESPPGLAGQEVAAGVIFD